MPKVLVCGARDLEPKTLLRNIFRLLSLNLEDVTIIHGAARGVDRTAGLIAKEFGFAVEEFPADWEKYGKGAGPIRNQQMLDQNPDSIIAIHYDDSLGKGTKDMVTRSKKAGKEPLVFITDKE